MEQRTKTTVFVEFILDMISDLGDARSRAMFGGHGIYNKGVMVGLISSGVFYLKVDDENRPQFESAAAKPFSYHRKGRKQAVIMSYWEVPANVLENREALCQWTLGAHEAALRSKRRTSKRK
jgi:DNA transformation protein